MLKEIQDLFIFFKKRRNTLIYQRANTIHNTQCLVYLTTRLGLDNALATFSKLGQPIVNIRNVFLTKYESINDNFTAGW